MKIINILGKIFKTLIVAIMVIILALALGEVIYLTYIDFMLVDWNKFFNFIFGMYTIISVFFSVTAIWYIFYYKKKE
jgi:hypothetical protein